MNRELVCQPRIDNLDGSSRQRIADSIAQIAKDNHIADPLLALGLKWQNFDNKKMNGKPLTVREIMGVYAQAKDTWEAKQQGLSDRGAQGFVKNLGASHTDIIEAVERIIPQKQLDGFWNAVYAANQFALDYQLNAGMIDPDTRNRYTRRYYVPQRGWRERDFDGIDNAYVKDNGNRLYGNPYNAALVKAHALKQLHGLSVSLYPIPLHILYTHIIDYRLRYRVYIRRPVHPRCWHLPVAEPA